jgi:hypothetical protein
MGFNPPELFSFGIFRKSFSDQILVEQRKTFARKILPFFRKKNLKNQEYALEFGFFFAMCSINVHIQN